MASKQEMDMEALHAKLDAVIEHLGLTVDTTRSARLAAEEKARAYWGPGGEGWKQINGGGQATVEALEAQAEEIEAANKDQEAYRKSEMAKREAAVQAQIDEAKAQYEALKGDVKAEQAALEAEAEADDAPKAESKKAADKK